MAKYQARQNGPLSTAQANLVATECNAMEKQGVLVTPPNLVSRSKGSSSRLHSLFEWNNSVAAKQHRLAQARSFLSSVYEIVVNKANPVRSRLSVEVNTTAGPERAYETRRRVLRSNTHLDQMSRQLYARIKGAVKTAEDLDLGDYDKEWSSLIGAVHRHMPIAAQLDEEEEEES